jgi:hypothetical protein
MMARLRNLWGEPVVIWGAFQALTAMGESFGWLGGIGIHGQVALGYLLLVEQAIAAVHVALVTHRTLLAPAVELFKACATLGVIYGLHITTEQTGLFITFMTAFFALVHQSQTSPIPPPPLDVSPSGV